MDYDFITDSDKIQDLIDLINEKVKIIEASVNGMIGSLDQMNAMEAWSGDTYNTFKNNFNNKKESLLVVSQFLLAYKSLLENVSEKTISLSSDISSACNI